MKLRRLATRDAGFDAALAALTRFEAAQDPSVGEAVRAIIADVRARGDAAVLEYTEKFDRVKAASLADLQKDFSNITIPGAQGQALRDTPSLRFKTVSDFKEITKSTPVWKEGMSEWVTLEDIAAVRQREIFEREADRLGRAPPVVRGADVLAHPRGALSALCAALERVDGESSFIVDEWLRPGGGGGLTSILAGDGDVEKAAVNFAAVEGALERLRRAAEREFPHARRFRRPGFD